MRVDKVYKSSFGTFEVYGRAGLTEDFKPVYRIFLRIGEKEVELSESATLELINSLNYALEDAKS
jgi:hypothetical protein